MALFAPVLVIFGGSLLVRIPDGVRRGARAGRAPRRRIVALALILSAIALIWGAILALMPAELGRALLGSSWAGARALFLLRTLLYAVSGTETALVIGMRSLAAATRSFLVRLVQSVTTVAGEAARAGIGGASGAIWELAAVYLLELLLWWWQFTEALRIESPASSEPSDEDRVGEETIVEVVGVTEGGVGEGHG